MKWSAFHDEAGKEEKKHPKEVLFIRL